MKNFEREKAAFAASLCRRGTAILGRPLAMRWIPEEENALGYTSCSEPTTVHVSWGHPHFFDPLDEEHKNVLRGGVFAHELLHQVYTNFDYTNAVTNSMKNKGEAAIFMEFANTLEDPAIEYFAPNAFGGWLLDSLHFSIRHLYKMSPAIGDEPTPYRQLINALIMFGDMGMVKGKFTYPEAEEYFIKVAPLYNRGIECPDAKERIDIAKECFEICRPLWEKDLEMEEIMNKLIEELMKALDMKGSPEEGGEPAPSKSSSGERRKTLIKKMEKAEGKGKKSEEKAEGKSEGSESKEESDGSESDEKKDKGTPGSDTSTSCSGSADTSESEESDDSKGSPKDSLTTSEEEADELAEEESEVSSESLEDMSKQIEKAEKDLEREEEKERKKETTSDLPDYDIKGINWSAYRASNTKVKAMPRDVEEYGRLTARYNWDIKRLTKTLSKIFEADREEIHRSTSGGYNIMRGTIGCTAKIFDRRKDPDGKKDAAVVLCVDLSGSMGCENRIGNARKTAIVFAETLDSLKVPYYIIGFSADENGDKNPNHFHFVDWKNLKKDKASLASMTSRRNNFDGYSIRYAAKLLEERRESNKILFVISDGLPACHAYSGDTGVADTIMAVKDARKYADTVFGVALGSDVPTDVLHKMYGNDFIAVRDPQMLTNTLCKKLEKVIKK